MAKPILKFAAVPYEVNGHKGYRPQLEQQNPVSDLDFCREVVTEKRLAMSAEELLHALEMVGEVGPKKVSEDGRPRAVTKLLKWNRYAQGNLESPTSPWNDDCKAVIRAQLLGDAEKVIDASFTNVNTGIGVKLDNVTFIGAKSVQNVIKVNADFAAYGRHMEFIADGEAPDTAWLEFNGTAYPLANKASDVSSATFAFPAALADIEPGAQVVFWMKSRGGVADGQIYTSKKQVTVLASDVPPVPTITKIESQDYGGLCRGFDVNVRGENLSFDAARGDSVEVTCTDEDGETHTGTVPASAVEDDGSGTLLVLKSPEGCAISDLAKSDTMVTFKVTIGGKVLEHETECLGS